MSRVARILQEIQTASEKINDLDFPVYSKPPCKSTIVREASAEDAELISSKSRVKENSGGLFVSIPCADREVDLTTATPAVPNGKRKAVVMLNRMEEIVNECNMTGEMGEIKTLRSRYIGVTSAIKSLQKRVKVQTSEETRGGTLQEKLADVVNEELVEDAREAGEALVVLQGQLVSWQQQRDALKAEVGAEAAGDGGGGGAGNSALVKAAAARALLDAEAELRALEQRSARAEAATAAARVTAAALKSEAEQAQVVVAAKAEAEAAASGEGEGEGNTGVDEVQVWRDKVQQLEAQCAARREQVDRLQREALAAARLPAAAAAAAASPSKPAAPPAASDLRCQQLEGELRELQEEVARSGQMVRASLQATDRVKGAVRSMVHQMELRGSAVGAALGLLLEHSGEMLIPEFKTELAARLMATTKGRKPGTAGATSAMYALVANSLVKLNRSSNTIICLVCG